MCLKGEALSTALCEKAHWATAEAKALLATGTSLCIVEAAVSRGAGCKHRPGGIQTTALAAA